MKCLALISGKISVMLALVFITVSCNNKKNADKQVEELTIPEKIAMAHGFEHWSSIKELHFTFNVDRDTIHFERSWSWVPGEGLVVSASGEDTVSYKKTEVDSSLTAIDAAFINDKYWLLAPFNLIWDRDNYEYTHIPEAKAPLSGDSMQKLTIVYKSTGGYTPGDAYDFYFQDDFILREWVFRKSNQDEPSLSTTWEGYQQIGGIRVATEYRREDPTYLLSFSNLKVK